MGSTGQSPTTTSTPVLLRPTVGQAATAVDNRHHGMVGHTPQAVVGRQGPQAGVAAAAAAGEVVLQQATSPRGPPPPSSPNGFFITPRSGAAVFFPAILEEEYDGGTVGPAGEETPASPAVATLGNKTPSSPSPSLLGTIREKKFWRPKFRSEDQEELEIITENILIEESDYDHMKEEYTIEEGQTREFIDPMSARDQGIQEVVGTLLDWLNNSLASQDRVRLTDLAMDCRDGQVLSLVIEKIMGGGKIILPWGEYVQSRERQKLNLEFVLDKIQEILEVNPEQGGWCSASVHAGELLSVLRLILAIVRYCIKEDRSVPILPRVLKTSILRITKKQGVIHSEKRAINLMGDETISGKRDGFDTLIDHSPEKLRFVQLSLSKFVNSHLKTIGREVKNFETDFTDGVNLCFLIGCLEGFFLPFYSFHLHPSTSEEKLMNMNLAFDLLEEAGLGRPFNRAREVVCGDLKSTLRIVYTLFIKYRSQSQS